MATRTKPCQETFPSARPGMPPVYHHLYALLHTLRALEGQQDHLCTLLAEMQRTGKANAKLRLELTDLLHDLPVASLDSEMRAVWVALEQAS